MKERGSQSSPLTLRYAPEPAANRWLALFPIGGPAVLLGILYLIDSTLLKTRALEGIMGSVFIITIIVLFTVGYVIGWVRGFPRWWWSYPLFLILFGFLVQNSSTPGLMITGMGTNNDLWGWRAWIPLVGGTLLAIILSIFSRPYRHLWQGLWHEPTRLAFAVYSILPYFSIALFDETRDSFPALYLLITFFVFLVGGWFYLAAKEPVRRLLILVGSALGMTLINLTAITLYWNGRTEYWMTAPIPWQESVLGALMGLALVAILLVIPVAILEFLRLLVYFQSRNVNPQT